MGKLNIEIIADGVPFGSEIGNPIRFGVHQVGDYHVFMVPVPAQADCDLLLYLPESKEPDAVIPMKEQENLGMIRQVTLRWPKRLKLEYMYRVNGRLESCPYGKAVSASGRSVVEPVKQAKTEPLHIPFNEMILYKAHVKGLTMGKGSGARHRGTFTGVKEKIPYLKELGVNALLLMPVYEFQEETNVVPMKHTDPEVFQGFAIPEEVTEPVEPEKEETLTNYWGYVEGRYFVPKKSYCATADSTKEFADLVDALHTAGIELHLELFFAEDCLASFAVDVLRYWKSTYKVDGFHLIGGGSWVNAVLADPLLKKTKLFYAGYSPELMELTDVTYWGSHEVRPSAFGVTQTRKPYERNLVEYNRSYADHMRRFLKGDDNTVRDAAWFTSRNYCPAPAVNYFADQDGFTMWDMVSYDVKHNEANGQGNLDGSYDNFSWNCGTEGPTAKKAVNALRLRQLKNAFLLLAVSQGIPMIYAGDEIMNTQEGNNNTWCQDNETGWVSWKKRKDSLLLQQFLKDVLAFRKEHPVLHQIHEITHADKLGFGIPDLSYHGVRAWIPEFFPDSHMLGMLYCGSYAEKADGQKDTSIYIAANMDWREREFALPSLSGGEKWMVKIDTSLPESVYPDGKEAPVQVPEGQAKKLAAAPRSVIVLIAGNGR
ncbi:MAG: alpha-amylase family glycosyl hydrolase [Lachnospiraceae bacterium]|nr:alpha-amylase family glycosyl hydrolase [Lachnospiraceae bacterium]